jgi:hypothetical protein
VKSCPSTTIVTGTERTREIGVRLAIWATENKVLRHE